jgi:general secretion pathway protein J
MKKHAAGFTLMEVLIATFIASIVAVMSITAIGFAVRAKAIQSAKADRLSELQLAYVIMQNDIEQALNRPIRNRIHTLEPAFEGGNPILKASLRDMKVYVQLTRGGIVNPLWQQVQSSMQRVNYGLQNNDVVRITWQALDQGANSEPSMRTILHGVHNLRWQFINDEGLLMDQWRTSVQFEEGNGSEEMIMDAIPRGVRVSFDYDELGTIDWLFALAGTPNNASQD